MAVEKRTVFFRNCFGKMYSTSSLAGINNKCLINGISAIPLTSLKIREIIENDYH